MLPAISSAGAATAGTNGDGYCSANASPWCSQVDMQAANTAAWVTTPHTCAAAAASGYVSSCDPNGCGAFALSSAGSTSYGAGTGYTINTLLPFSVATSFRTDTAGALSSIQTVLS